MCRSAIYRVKQSQIPARDPPAPGDRVQESMIPGSPGNRVQQSMIPGRSSSVEAYLMSSCLCYVLSSSQVQKQPETNRNTYFHHILNKMLVTLLRPVLQARPPGLPLKRKACTGSSKVSASCKLSFYQRPIFRSLLQLNRLVMHFM